VLQRIAVDAGTEQVWAIDASGLARHFDGSNWITPPGNGSGVDICARNGTAWVVGMDAAVYRNSGAGWTRLAQVPPALARLSVDRDNGTLWGVGVDGRILSLASAARSWAEHPGGGRAKAIAAFGGLPYVIGLDNGLWKSLGAAGWQPVTVLQRRT